MDLKSKASYFSKIKLVLIFFLLVFFQFSCKQSKEVEFEVNYKQGKAVSITFENIEHPEIYIEGEPNMAVLGKIDREKEFIHFTPVIPFSAGLTYEIRQENTLIDTFKIEENQKKSVPSIINIYPSSDTVPQNLLKMYIKFSEPMQAIGNALDYIKVMDDKADKEIPVFLELENDLWNVEHTILTLWLDPGRIKQDLIPNREQGIPLDSGKNYSILISDKWNSEQGVSLDSIYVKKLIVGDKKTSRPNVAAWSLTLPKANARDTLWIEFDDILDSQLILNTLTVYSKSGENIDGNFNLINNERGVLFIPDQEWESKEYILRIENRLEDLAGNNLVRLFDTDLNKQQDQGNVKKALEFRID